MVKKYVVFAPPFDEKSGGIVCLHKLCHLINETGLEAYIYPSFENIEINRSNWLLPVLRFTREIYRKFIPFKLNENWNTPIIRNKKNFSKNPDWVVIYYEQVFGNPLTLKNVVRWFLHTPGYHTHKVYYGFNELHIKFNTSVKDFVYPFSRLSNNHLKIIHYPLNHYNLKELSSNRNGTAYCIRKGKGKAIVHDLNNSILIDNLSHEKIAKLFKSVKMFVSYDCYTAYSVFAVLCGCISVVIPDPDVTEEEWYPELSDRYGIAYGFENIKKAEETKHLVLPRIISELKDSEKSVLRFTKEVEEYFQLPRYNFYRNNDIKKL